MAARALFVVPALGLLVFGALSSHLPEPVAGLGGDTAVATRLQPPVDSFDVLIVGGSVIDGTSSASRTVDVGLRATGSWPWARICPARRRAPSSKREGVW